MADTIKTYKSTLNGQELDKALRNIGKVAQSVEQAAGYAAQAKDYADSIDPDRFATAVAYTLTVPASGWTTGSLTWGGMTLTRKCTVTAADASGSPTGLAMGYAGGDDTAHCQIALLDTAAGSVTFWAQAAPAKDTQVRITEVRG